MKYRANWYDHTQGVQVDGEPIVANSIAEATTLAYQRYNGNPPAPLLWLEEMGV